MIAPNEPLDDFYIGYEGGIPPSARRRVRGAVTVFAIGGALAVATALLAASRLPESRFEFATVTEMTGVLKRIPYPVLDSASGRVWLVGPGKSGAEVALMGVPNGPVTLQGRRIERGDRQMFEVTAHSVIKDARDTRVAKSSAAVDASRATPVTLRGEILDSKCFLGVMNPGDGIVHRDCARRCLSGGTPPMLLVRDDTHREELVLLVSADGGPIGRVLAPVAGIPVELSGRLARGEGGYVLFVDEWRRLLPGN